MNPIIETVDYLYFGKKNTIIVVADQNTKTMVLREHAMGGPSLTNTIEMAIEESFRRIFRYRKNTQEVLAWTVLQDCGEEGIFKVNFELEQRGGMTTNGGGLFEKQIVANPQWAYFSKDLKAFDVLFGAKG